MIKEISNKYEVVEEISKGGMGTIYKANQKKLNRLVAIKVLHPQYASDDSFIKRFEREARSMAKLEHPNIIRVYDVDKWEDTQYIVMEFVDGQDLRSLLKEKGMLSPVLAARIIKKVAQALEYAHQQGIIHRDIKPGNVLIDKSGDIKVGDFGIAAAVDEISITLTGQIVGTPEYMSPEQLQGEEIAPKMDIYSLGMVFYKLLAGKTPFDGLSKASVIGKIMNEQGKMHLDYPQVIPDAVNQIISNFFALDSSTRYINAKSLINDIDAFLSQNPEDKVEETCVFEPTEVSEAPKKVPALSDKPILKINKQNKISPQGKLGKSDNDKKNKAGHFGQQKSRGLERNRLLWPGIILAVLALAFGGAGYWYMTKGVYAGQFDDRKVQIDEIKEDAYREKDKLETMGAPNWRSEEFADSLQALENSDLVHKQALDLYEKGDYLAAVESLVDVKYQYDKVKKDFIHLGEEIQKEVTQSKEKIINLKKESEDIKNEAIKLGANSYPSPKVKLKIAKQNLDIAEELEQKGLLKKSIGFFQKAKDIYLEVKEATLTAKAEQEKKADLLAKNKKSADKAKTRMHKAKKNYRKMKGTSSYKEALLTAKKGEKAYDQQKYITAASLFNSASKKFKKSMSEAAQEVPEEKGITKRKKNLLNNILKRFVGAYERKNLYMIKKMSILSSTKEQLLKTLFENYKTINLDVEDTKFHDNFATTTLFIKSLTNKEGDTVQPGNSWKKSFLIIPFEKDKWGKIKW